MEVLPVHFQVSVPASVDAGVQFLATVTALDGNGATVTGFSDTVHLTSSDKTATPGYGYDITLNSGSHTFPVTLRSAGTQTITATDSANPTIAGQSHLAVRPPAK